MKNIEVLDCTLRDGSYLINFQFNVNDTFQISKLLEKAGVKYIEVGHGLGLDAGIKKNLSLEADIDYIIAAKQATTTSQIGSFFIPGIGNKDSLKLSKEAGLDFVRIGVNVSDYTKSYDYIEYAKSLGLTVWLNLMKSYAADKLQWKKICNNLRNIDFDFLAVVDSAGGMTPERVKRYCEIAAEHSNHSIGFHGHNNIELAVANCLSAIEGGATVVDGTLFGMGRSGGNARTEVIAAILEREGLIHNGKYDLSLLIEVASQVIAPLTEVNQGDHAVELASGLNYFHSSFLSTVKKHCDDQKLSTFKTILNLPQESHQSVNDEMVKKVIKEYGKYIISDFDFKLDKSNSIIIKDFDELAKYLNEIKSKCNCPTAISVSLHSASDLRVSNIYICDNIIHCHIVISNANLLRESIQKLSGCVSYWLIESLIKENKEFNFLQNLNPIYFEESSIVKSTIDSEVLNSNSDVFLVESNSLDFSLIRHENSNNSNPKYLISFNVEKLTTNQISKFSKNSEIVLTNICKIENSAWDFIEKNSIKIYRLNYTLPLAYESSKLIKSRDLETNCRGEKKFEEITIVSGGSVAKKGSLVVDNFKQPSRVLGISDGNGGIEPLSDLTDIVDKFKDRFFIT